MKSILKNEIYEAIDSIAVIDTHEHIKGTLEKRPYQPDVFCEYVPDYFCRDLLSAGLPPKDMEFLLEPNHSMMEKWNKVSKYWDYCRRTGYGKVLDTTVRELYGLNGVNENTIEALNEAVVQSFDINQYKKVLHDKCNIKTVLVDNSDPEVDPEFFRYMMRIDHMIFPLEEADIIRLELELCRPISSLDDWLEACTVSLRKALANGAAGFKLVTAYRRSLFFDRPTYSEAQIDFREFIRYKGITVWLPHPIHVGRAFSDYVLHHVLNEIQQLNAVLQVHTGYLDGIGGYLEDSDPALLNNLFVEYPAIRFDLFHMGFPYQEKAMALCKMFPNVCLDFCWTYALAPESAKITLKKCLTTLPVNKIFAFGGDHVTVDPIAGHLQIAKNVVSTVLAEFIDDDLMDLDAALWTANRIFYQNPVDFYQLKFDS